MPGRPMSEEQKRKKRGRERERQNGTPVISQGWWKLLHKFFSWTLNCLLFQVDAYFSKVVLSFFPLFRNETRIFIVNWN